MSIEYWHEVQFLGRTQNDFLYIHLSAKGFTDEPSDFWVRTEFTFLGRALASSLKVKKKKKTTSKQTKNPISFIILFRHNFT